MSKTVTLRVPRPFDSGPLYGEDGNLIPSSWPSGLTHEGIKGWRKIGQANGGLSLCDFVCEDSWDLSAIPGGWRATSSNIWDGVTQHQYNEDGELIANAYNVELATNQSDYMRYFPDDTEYKRHHVYFLWPDILD